ncbi:MAG: hypothetical protein AAB263_13905, partial [Planctomycetota bacterium]
SPRSTPPRSCSSASAVDIGSIADHRYVAAVAVAMPTPSALYASSDPVAILYAAQCDDKTDATLKAEQVAQWLANDVIKVGAQHNVSITHMVTDRGANLIKAEQLLVRDNHPITRIDCAAHLLHNLGKDVAAYEHTAADAAAAAPKEGIITDLVKAMKRAHELVDLFGKEKEFKFTPFAPTRWCSRVEFVDSVRNNNEYVTRADRAILERFLLFMRPVNDAINQLQARNATVFTFVAAIDAMLCRQKENCPVGDAGAWKAMTTAFNKALVDRLAKDAGLGDPVVLLIVLLASKVTVSTAKLNMTALSSRVRRIAESAWCRFATAKSNEEARGADPDITSARIAQSTMQFFNAIGNPQQPRATSITISHWNASLERIMKCDPNSHSSVALQPAARLLLYITNKMMTTEADAERAFSAWKRVHTARLQASMHSDTAIEHTMQHIGHVAREKMDQCLSIKVADDNATA